MIIKNKEVLRNISKELDLEHSKKKEFKTLSEKIKNTQKLIFKHIKNTGCRNPADCSIIFMILKKLMEAKE